MKKILFLRFLTGEMLSGHMIFQSMICNHV